MRVITGKAKGHALKWPKTPHIRPTTDRVREAIFSALEALAVDWARVLDLYAGTGALGIEALSRGAEQADFVEQNPKCCEIIRENLRHTDLSDRATVHRLDVQRAIKTLNERYSLVFLDPPYAETSVQKILEALAHSSLLAEQATIVMEHSPKRVLSPNFGRFQLIKRLLHGDTSISIFQCRGGTN